MEAAEYQKLFELESDYWWFRGLRAVLLDMCRRLGMGPADCMLDAGCGTGKTLETLCAAFAPQSFGLDISPVPAPYWQYRGLSRMCRASVNEAPFRDESFDFVLGIDVLECDGVREQHAYRELWRILRPGGYLLLLVPAFDWLLSPQHHRAVGASRRYTRGKLLRLLRQQPVHLVRLTYFFASVFPLVVIYRLWLRLVDRQDGRPPRSELSSIPGTINRLLFRLVEAERQVLAWGNMPFGSSLLAVVQKPARL